MTDIDSLLRRFKPEKRSTRLARRPDEALRFIADEPCAGPVMPDTTVYIHVAQDKAPSGVLATLAGGGPLLHAAVCLCEIAVSLGQLDPRHALTRSRAGYLADVLRRVPPYRTHSPEANDWTGAGLLVGMVARLNGLDAHARRKLLSDALVLLTARRLGATVLTANVNDFDLLAQLVTDGKVAFYRTR